MSAEAWRAPTDAAAHDQCAAAGASACTSLKGLNQSHTYKPVANFKSQEKAIVLTYINQLTMSTYTQILYQVVWTLKYRLPVLSKDRRNELFKYMAGILRHKNCKVYAINGIEDHIHLVFRLHPSVPLSSLIKDVKLASSKWIKENAVFKDFNGWQKGYAAFTYHYSAKDRLIRYVTNQEEHHRKKAYRDELIKLLKDHSVVYDPKYLP
jgi:putative transposase